jgi:hypothetical protein
MPNALLDLLMQSMKGDQQQLQQGDGFSSNNSSLKHNSWSSGNSNPPSPIGNNRIPFGGLGQPQRNGSNGSSEMSSPQSPSSYSPFSRNSSKLLESGNGNGTYKQNLHFMWNKCWIYVYLLFLNLASPIPTSTAWSNAVLGSPPHSGGYTAHHHHQQQQGSFGSQSRNIWASPSISQPGATSLNNNHNNNSLMNPLGIKRKQAHHEAAGMEGCSDTFLGGTVNLGLTHHQLHAHMDHQHNNHESLPSSHYADSYFKKKKKN